MSNKTTLVAIVVIVVALAGIGGIFFAYNNSKNAYEAEKDVHMNDDGTEHVDDQDTQSDTDEPGAVASEQGVTIVFTDNGFDKTKYTVKAGETITVKNDSSQAMQFSSGDHPTHTINSELNAPEIAAGKTTTLKLTRVGEFSVHDHIRSQFSAAIEVTE